MAMSENVTVTESGTIEKASKPRAFDDDSLRGIGSFNDALDTLRTASNGIVDNFDDYGTGFVVLPTAEKRRLCGVPFVIIEWAFTSGKNGEFVSAYVVTKTGEKLIVNDGSTGMRDQLRKVADMRLSKGFSELGAMTNLFCARGLKESTYPYTDPKTGEVSEGVTYYIG